MELFKKAMDDDDDLVKRVIEDYFSLGDMKRILAIGQKGYIEDDVDDKIDFYNRLPEETKQSAFNQSNPIFALLK